MKKIINLLLIFSILLSSLVMVSFPVNSQNNNEIIHYYNNFDSEKGFVTEEYTSNVDIDLITDSDGNTVMKIESLRENGDGVMLWYPKVDNRADKATGLPEMVLEFRAKLTYVTNHAAYLDTVPSRYDTSVGNIGLNSLRLGRYWYPDGVFTDEETAQNEQPLQTPANHKNSEWHTYTIVYSGTEHKRDIYMDGNLLAANVESLYPDNDYVTHGVFQYILAAYLPGAGSTVEMDYLKIYQRASGVDATLKNAEATSVNELVLNFNSEIYNIAPGDFKIIDGTNELSVNQIELSEDKKTAKLKTDSLQFGKTYTLKIDGCSDAFSREITKEITFKTREARCFIESVEIKNDDFTVGNKTLKISYVNETTDKLFPVIFAVYKTAEGKTKIITKQAEIPASLSGENDSVAIPISEEDASVQLFAVNDILTPYAVSGITEYNSSGKAVKEKAETEPAVSEIIKPDYSYLPDADELTVTVDLPDEDSRTCVLLVLKKDKTLADINLASPEDSVIYAGAAQPTGGKLTYSFIVDYMNAPLPVMVFDSCGNKISQDIYSYTSSKYVVKRLNDDVNTTESTDVIGAFIAEFSDYLNLDMTSYNKFNNTDANKYICQSIINQRNETDNRIYANTDEFKAAFNKGVSLAELYYGENPHDIIKNNNNLSDENAYTVYSTHMSEPAKEYFISELKTNPGYTEEEIKEDVCEKIYICGIYKAVTYNQVEEIIRLSGADMSEYGSLNDTEAIDLKMKGSLYSSTSDLISAFYSAVSAQKSKETGGSIIISGGGGGGGGRAVKITPEEEKNAAEKEENPKDELKHNFKDISNYGWAEDAIAYLYSNGIIIGKTDEGFAPADIVTRAELVKMLVEAFDISGKATNNPFYDVNKADWYYDYILTAFENGITDGTDENEFSPDKPVTREMAAALISRTVSEKNILIKGNKYFNDSYKISDWAKEAVSILGYNKILNGYETGEFAPQKLLTRAEAACIIYNTLMIGGEE